MHIQLLDNTLLFQIIKYCNIDDLKNLLYLNKNFESMRIYRLYLGIIAKNNYALTCINNINDYIKYDDYKLNDTVYHTQRFYSHFAYDDGSPESAYGINVTGANFCKINKLFLKLGF